jgi:uncharacterized repeat protein (TIGR03803 family)
MMRTGKISLIAACAFALLVFPQTSRADPFNTFHQFQGPDFTPPDGEFPEAGLVIDGSGSGILYGSTFGSLASGEPGRKCSKNCGNIYSISETSQLGDPTDVVYSFQAGDDGAFPTGETLFYKGIFYGTTEYGTRTNCGGLGCGTLYEINGDGTEKHLFMFCLLPACADGVFPHAGLTVGPQKSLYGTTTFGGTGNGLLCGSSLGGCGVVYQLAADGPHPIYSFCSKVHKNVCVDGAVPLSGLLADGAGNLYGTTQFGGRHSSGTIFKLSYNGTKWIEKVLYSFCGTVKNGVCTDGSVPQAGLIESGGELYGTTAYGGTACDDNPNGCGTVFSVAPDGTAHAVLYSFRGENLMDGAFPQAPLVADGLGNLYGTTLRGGGNGICERNGIPNGCGTLFQLGTIGGPEVILHAFGQSDNAPDGAHPAGALALDSGVLYGATTDKGDPTCLCGTLYSYMLPTGKTARLRVSH